MAQDSAKSPSEVTINTSAHSSIDSLVDQTRLIEELGYDRISIGEANGYNSVPILTRIAENTRSLGISNDVFSPFSRSPALIAQTAATLQEISDGRYRVGVGASAPALVEGWHGRSFDRPLRQVEEAVNIIRQALNGEPVDYEGEFFQLQGMKLRSPVPEQPVPVDLAALGPQFVRLTGRLADGWVPQLFTPSGLKERLEDLRAGAEEEDRNPEEIRVQFSLRCCALEDREEARNIARNHVAFMVGVYGPYYYQSLQQQGYEEEADEIRGAFHDDGREKAAEAVSDELLDELMAAGNPGEVQETVERFSRIDGVDVVRLSFPLMASLEAQKTTLEALA